MYSPCGCCRATLWSIQEGISAINQTIGSRIICLGCLLPLEQPADYRYAELRTALEQAGTPIGPNDMLIAAHAMALGLVLVTANVNEFSRVPGLALENWLM